ncbi:MAG: hypothetical protein J7L34_00085 [Thermotogaceae bacterium]|nr:hypothetical protein [Thermotogaceae bacterium]
MDLVIDGETLRIIGNRILLLMDEVSKKEGSIYLPEVVKERKQRRLNSGVIMAISEKAELPYPFKRGQKVYIKPYIGAELMINKKLYKIIEPDDILAVETEEEND